MPGWRSCFCGGCGVCLLSDMVRVPAEGSRRGTDRGRGGCGRPAERNLSASPVPSRARRTGGMAMRGGVSGVGTGNGRRRGRLQARWRQRGEPDSFRPPPPAEPCGAALVAGFEAAAAGVITPASHARRATSNARRPWGSCRRVQRESSARLTLARTGTARTRRSGRRATGIEQVVFSGSATAVSFRPRARRRRSSAATRSHGQHGDGTTDEQRALFGAARSVDAILRPWQGDSASLAPRRAAAAAVARSCSTRPPRAADGTSSASAQVRIRGAGGHTTIPRIAPVPVV